MKRLLFTIAIIASILFSLPHKAQATFSYYCLGRDCSETVYSCFGPDCQWLSGDFTSTWYTGSYQLPYDMSFDGTYFTITNTDTTSIKLVNYGANVPAWGVDWTATSGPHVISVTNGSRVLAPCGYFQGDLLPSYATVYDSPSYTGDRYGNPGDGVLLASANGGRICASAPAPTATPTSAPTVISAPTGVTVVEGDANGGATIQTRSVKVTWAFPDAGAGCGGAWANTCPSSTTKFYIKFTGPSSVPQGQIASTGTRAYTTGASLTTNGTYTVNVCANNGTQEKCTPASFTKVPYPTGVLSGQLYERSPSVVPIACYAGARALYAGTVTLVPNTNGYSTTCTVAPSSGAALTYSCVAQLDNQNYDPNPNQSFTVQYQGNNLYSSVSCGITCGGPSPTPTITPSPTPTNTPTPTPTRTPTPTPTRTPTPSPTPVITTSNIDDNTLGTGQNQFEYVGNWTASTDVSAYAGTDHYSNTTGAYFQVRFTGTQIKGYFYRANNVGIAGVSIDGGAETMVDLYSSGSGNALGYTSPTLTQGTHIIKFRVTGNKNVSAVDTYIDVDYMQVTSVIAKANIKPSIRSKPAVAAASTAIYDDSVEGTGLGQFEYVGNWTAGWDSGNYNGYDHFSNATNAYFNFRFNGNQVKLYFFEDNNMGYAAVSIDGGTETNIDLYSSFFQFTVLAYTSPILADGNHTVRVRVTGQNNGTSSNTFLDVDRADVTSGLAPPPTSTPIPTPTTGAASAGLVGAYYNNIDFTAYAFTKVDTTINRYFTSGTPETGISPGTWSARWTGYIVPQYTQTYTFYAVSDDGQRLYVNNQLLVDDWADHSATERTATIALTAGVAYPITYEYYDNIAGSQASLSWSSASVAKQIIPSTSLYTANPSGPTSTPTPTAAPAATAGLIGNYYNNMDFTAFALTKTDTTINRAFTSTNPETGVNAGTWSARWTGYVVPQYTQTYTFYALSDDGERLYVNNQLLVNDWNDHGATESSGNIALTAGVAYPITYEYYDNLAGSQYALSWSSASQAKQIIPSTRLYTSNPSAPTSTPTPTATPTSTPTPTPTPVNGPIACTNIYTPTFDVNTGAATSKTMNLYFNLNDATSGGGGFYKVKNASYYDHDHISSVFPVNHQAYDTDDSPLVEHFNRGDDATNIVGSGVVMSNGAQSAGGVGGTYSGISPRGWTSSTYQQTAAQIGSNFITYLKNRRDLITITSLADAAYTSKTYGSFLVNGDLTISAADAAAFNNKNVVIAVSGNLNINTNLIPTAGNVAFIAQAIYINESVTEVRALLTGNTVSFASSAFVGKSANPLKIVGSVSSGTSVDTSKRSRTDSLKPSLFIVTNPDAYTSLLPLISVIKYDWTQLQ